MSRSTRCTANGARMAAAPRMLETLQIPYTHSGVLASALAMHKEKSKTIFREAGVPVAESKLVDLEIAATQHPDAAALCGQAGGRGLERRRAHRHAALPMARRRCILEQRDLFGDHAMVERFIPGRNSPAR